MPRHIVQINAKNQREQNFGLELRVATLSWYHTNEQRGKVRVQFLGTSLSASFGFLDYELTKDHIHGMIRLENHGPIYNYINYSVSEWKHIATLKYTLTTINIA